MADTYLKSGIRSINPNYSMLDAIRKKDKKFVKKLEQSAEKGEIIRLI